MPCEDCKHSITYLYRAGAISDSIFNMIIAGHQNKKYYDMISTMKPSKLMYNSIKSIPPFLDRTYRKFLI